MRNTLITLANFHYWLGLIGRAEYLERVHVAIWLSDDDNRHLDPRSDEHEGSDARQIEEDPDQLEGDSVIVRSGSAANPGNPNEPPIVELVCLNVWVFTKSDPDSYPSVPHGHYQSQNRTWPKLNPYVGRVFLSRDLEEPSKRLSKKEMRSLWRNETFRSFCREMVVWYEQAYPHHKFPVQYPLRLPRW